MELTQLAHMGDETTGEGTDEMESNEAESNMYNLFSKYQQWVHQFSRMLYCKWTAFAGLVCGFASSNMKEPQSNTKSF